MKNLIFGFFLVTFFGCTNPNTKEMSYINGKNDLGTININPHNLVSTLSVDTAFYIPLETKDEVVIGEIDKVMVRDSSVYVLDISKAKGLFKYDFSGKLSCQIGRQGKGPGEYVNPNDFAVDDDKVYIWSANQKKLFSYSLSGELIGELKSEFFFMSFFKIGHNFYCDRWNRGWGPNIKSGYNLIKTDSALQPLEGFFEQKETASAENIFRFYEYENNLFHSPYANDTIYQISEKGVSPKYVFKYKEGLQLDPVIGPFQTDKFLYFHFVYSKRVYFAMYDKHTQKTVCFEPFVETGSARFGAMLVGVYNGYFISVIPAFAIQQRHHYLIKNLKDDEMEAYKNSQLYTIAADIKTDDNPVLSFVRFK